MAKAKAGTTGHEKAGRTGRDAGATGRESSSGAGNPPANPPAIASIKELREKRAGLLPRIKELRDKVNSKEGWTAEDRTNWEAVNRDFEGISESIDVNEQADERIEYLERSISDRRNLGRDDFGDGNGDGAELDSDSLEKPGLRDLAISAWMRSHSRKSAIRRSITPRHEEAADAFGVELGSSECEIRLAPLDMMQRRAMAYRLARNIEERALSLQQDTAGGYWSVGVSGFMPTLEINLLYFGGMLNIADVIRTDDNRPLPWPTADDTNNMGHRLNEFTADTDQDPKAGNVTYNAYVYSSGIIKVPNSLVRGATIDLGSFLGKMIGIRLARKGNLDWTTGVGVNCPRGILLDATLGYTAAKATAIAYDDIRNLIHAVDPAYREGPGVGFMLHDKILLQIKLLKDGQGRFLWHSDPVSGAPSRIDGFPYTINQSMDSSMASGKKTLLWGNLPHYKIREVGTMRLVYLKERYAELDQAAYIGFMEWDGGLLDAGTHPVQYLQH